jgi:hypothetical protein
MIDIDEQELREIQEEFRHGLAASDEEYRIKMNASLDLYLAQMQGASEEQAQIYKEQYRQRKDALLQESIERDRKIITFHAQRMEDLDDRLRNRPNDIISPFWRVRVTHIAEEMPSHLHHFFQRRAEIYSKEALQEFFRFFLNNPKETAQSRTPYRVMCKGQPFQEG